MAAFDGPGNRVILIRNHENRSREGEVPVVVPAGNVLSHNDARGNAGVDCRDDTTGGAAAAPFFTTQNRWIANRGLEAMPPGICTPDPARWRWSVGVTRLHALDERGLPATSRIARAAIASRRGCRTGDSRRRR